MKKLLWSAVLRNLALAFCLAAVFYIPEWIFQRTGNMPLSAFAPSLAWLSLSMGLFLFSGLFGAALLLIDIVFFALPRIQRFLKIVFVSGVVTVTALLLANNFTNTIWAVSISAKSGAPWVNYYRAGLIIFFAYALFEISGLSQKQFLTRPRLIAITSILAVLSFLPAISYSVYSRFAPSGLPQKFTTSLKPEELPNILFLQGDGINAANMSIYGYERKTTPFLDSIKDRVNVWTNFYPSNCGTYGTHYALLTGISPLKHNIYYPPAQVPPEEASWSLPDILKSIGYTTYQDTVPYYADAAFMGLTTAFDIGNDSMAGSNPAKAAIIRLLAQGAYKIMNPAIQSFRRTINLKAGLITPGSVKGALDNVTLESAATHPDDEKVRRLTHLIQSEIRPWFAQVHLMASHGPTFPIRSDQFVLGRLPQVPWQLEFYDNAIFGWDNDVRMIVESLTQRDRVRNTVVFVTSDHGMAWKSAVKVPLITFRALQSGDIEPLQPNRNPEKLNSLHESVDIPLTALANIRAHPKPKWMTGHALGGKTPKRIVINAAELKPELGDIGEFIINQNQSMKFGPSLVNLIDRRGPVNLLLAPFASFSAIFDFYSIVPKDFSPANDPVDIDI